MAKRYDLELLHNELIAAGLPLQAIDNRNGEPTARWTRALTPQEVATATAIRDKHDPDAHQAAVDARIDAIAALAATAVGVTLETTTRDQRDALLAVLLYNAGAIDMRHGTIRPLDDWIRK